LRKENIVRPFGFSSFIPPDKRRGWVLAAKAAASRPRARNGASDRWLQLKGIFESLRIEVKASQFDAGCFAGSGLPAFFDCDNAGRRRRQMDDRDDHQ